jgi:predicted enzyme related to lactoylglutathione lyase
VVSEPFDVMDAGRMAVLADPEGAVFCVRPAKGHKGAKVVNEHGSLNFNGLATRDPEGAAAFYGAVFGWKTLVLPAGVMWTLPGYGDHLEERNSETPAHWSVTFAVDDAAATVARARELGGKVVAGRVDAPWTRPAVIKDPHGATFIASQFVPENKDLTAYPYRKAIAGSATAGRAAEPSLRLSSASPQPRRRRLLSPRHRSVSAIWGALPGSVRRG